MESSRGERSENAVNAFSVRVIRGNSDGKSNIRGEISDIIENDFYDPSQSSWRLIAMATRDCDQHFEVVQNFANSNNKSKRKQAQRALEILIDNRCTNELRWFVDNWSGSNSKRKRRVAQEALEHL
jgi:hypothetical protein